MKLRELLDEMAQIAAKDNLSSPMIVGGAARDKFLGKLKDIADIDITTGDGSIDFLVKEVSIFLGRSYNFKMKQMPTGYTTLTLGNLKIDFSAHFLIPNIEQILIEKGIAKPTEMQKELFSRDFTCNSLLLGMDLETMQDLTGRAIPDLKEKMIRTCLAPEITLTTNKNRVIRAIYLACKLDFDIDPAIIAWVSRHPESVRFASDHSLREKLNKAVKLNLPRTVSLLDQMGLWDYLPISEELHPYYLQRKGR